MCFDIMWESAQKNELLLIEGGDKSLRGAYAILNKRTIDIYIGSTRRSFGVRWKEHRTSLRAGKHTNPVLQNAWNKYGESAFAFCILEPVDDITQIEQIEQAWIDRFAADPKRRVYNLCPKAYSPTNRPVSLETRKKLSDVIKRSWADPEGRKRHTAGLKTLYATPEGKQLASQKAKKQWESQETRKKASESAKRYAAKPEVKQRRAERTKAMMSDPERRKQASLISKAYSATDAAKQMLTRINKQRWSKPEEKQKLAQRNSEQWADPQYRAKAIQRLAKTFDGFISPDGVAYKGIVNLKEFCQQHDLNPGAMHAVNNGKRKSHKGWKRIEE